MSATLSLSSSTYGPSLSARSSPPRILPLPGRARQRLSSRLSEGAICTILQMDFREFTFRDCLENRNESRIGTSRAARRVPRGGRWTPLGTKTHGREAFQLFSKQFLHALR